MGLWLVLGDDGDPVGPWVADGLTRRGLGPVLSLTTGDLISAVWAHTVGDDGADFTARLADGTALEGDRIAGVVNRIGFIPPACTWELVEADRDYALHELNAFFMSWLASIRAPVLNPPSARGLAGAWRPATEWALLAARAGLPHRPLTSTEPEPIPFAVPPAHTAITVDGEIVDDGLDEETRRACLRLADLAATPLLGVEFAVDQGDALVFTGASPQPPLPVAGEAVLDALAYVLEGRSAA